MKLRTLKIFGEKTEIKHDSFGDIYLYPTGTKRIIQAYFLFPRTLDGDKRRGLQVVEQTATIQADNNAEETIYSNKWINSRFVGASQLEKMTN